MTNKTKKNTEVVEEIKKWMQKEIIWDYDTTYGAFLEEKEVEEALIKRDQAKDTQAEEMIREVLELTNHPYNGVACTPEHIKKGVQSIAHKFGIDVSSKEL